MWGKGMGDSLDQEFVFLSVELECSSLGSAASPGGLTTLCENGCGEGSQSPLCEVHLWSTPLGPPLASLG